MKGGQREHQKGPKKSVARGGCQEEVHLPWILKRGQSVNGSAARTRRNVRCKGTWETTKCKRLLSSITNVSSNQNQEDQNNVVGWERVHMDICTAGESGQG